MYLCQELKIMSLVFKLAYGIASVKYTPNTEFKAFVSAKCIY